MKNFHLFLTCFLLLNACFGQNSAPSNKMYVINLAGTELYATPRFNAIILTRLNAGDQVMVEQIIQTDDTRYIGENFSLPGEWIKTSISNHTGFIFSSELSAMEPKITDIRQKNVEVDLLGELLSETTETEMIKTGAWSIPKEIRVRNYENGTYTMEAWDGCFTHYTEITNLKLHEVYHHLIGTYGMQLDEGGRWLPVFTERVGNVLKFDADSPVYDLQIEILEDGKFILSSYDCT